jgi:hypothetical protein
VDDDPLLPFPPGAGSACAGETCVERAKKAATASEVRMAVFMACVDLKNGW